MADLKISQLTDGGNAQAADEFVVARSGSNFRIDGASVAAAATSVGTLTSLTVSGDLTVDTSTLKVDSANNRVGIGTASPAAGYQLDVIGRGRFAPTASNYLADFISPESNQTTIQLYADNTNASITLGGTVAKPLTFYIGGSERLRLDASGNLGLGVTPSATSIAGVMMQFKGGAVYSSATNNMMILGNAFYNGTNWTYQNSAHATQYIQGGGSGQHQWYVAPSGTAGNAITFTQAMTLDASSNWVVGGTTVDPFSRGDERLATVNTTSASQNLALSLNAGSSAGRGAQIYMGAGGTRHLTIASNATESTVGTTSNTPLKFTTNDAERARITSGGDFYINVSTTGNGKLSVRGAGTTSATHSFEAANSSGNTRFLVSDDGLIRFYGSSGGESARITSGGDVYIGKTSRNLTTAGWDIEIAGDSHITALDNSLVAFNRQNTDGTLIEFAQAGTVEGNISVSGNTVSYNAFAGSHWSQLKDGSKPEILRGTVMEAINELCEWPGEQNERLPKAKVSDTAGSKKVYGVFMDWDNDWTETNDMYVTSLGAFVCRVAADVVVEQGDLLESNGDGTARVQADDVIRSSTIGKVTSTVKTHEYEDGTYCVPTVLYCG